MNLILFRSTIFCTICHCLAVFYLKHSNLLLSITMFTGILTSLLNHGFTFNFLIFIDRIMMFIGFLYNSYIIFYIENILKKKLCLILLIFSVLLYFYTKFINKKYKTIINIYHILAHIFLTINHIILMSEFSDNDIILFTYFNT
jgi:hypothetical protein